MKNRSVRRRCVQQIRGKGQTKVTQVHIENSV